MKAPLHNLAFLKCCVTSSKENIYSQFTVGRKESQETYLILNQVAIIKIKICRPLRHTLCSNPHHSFLPATVHICITGKAYKFVTVYFKQQRKHASQLASVFQHCLSSNKYWCLSHPEPSLPEDFSVQSSTSNWMSVGHPSCCRLLL